MDAVMMIPVARPIQNHNLIHHQVKDQLNLIQQQMEVALEMIPINRLFVP